MIKLAVIMFIVIAPTLAGFSVLVPLTIFGTGDMDGRLLILAAAIGVAIAVPVSLYVANRILHLVEPKQAA
ncbi:hypothetical protein [Coralliovum pocilloporae]|uniref:hypothetical protein n=1 Tax=Coralliovum pocilloporae TaxID=3066369 RepID=UPI00330762FB